MRNVRPNPELHLTAAIACVAALLITGGAQAAVVLVFMPHKSDRSRLPAGLDHRDGRDV